MRILGIMLVVLVLSGCVQQRASVSIVSTGPLSVTSEIVNGHTVIHYRTGGDPLD